MNENPNNTEEKNVCYKCGKDITEKVKSGKHFVMENNQYCCESCSGVKEKNIGDTCEFC